MMKLKLLLVALCSLLGCSSFEPLTKQEAALEIVYQLSLAVDAYTTSRIKYTEWVYEGNYLTQGIIGAQPSDGDIAALFLVYGAVHYLTVRALPRKWRPYFQGGTILLSVGFIVNNCNNGLC